tara:strand:- start:165 stop:824 length:660 start_codon:yes stop_codon:yes gene_type:complete
MVTTKESEVEPVNTFYAAFDDISTTRAWDRPNLYNLIKWRDTLFNLHNGLDGIDVFLVGGFAEYLHNPRNPLTWDADVCFIVDEDVDYNRIKTILDDSLRIALDIGIFIDQKAVTPYVFNFFQQLQKGVIHEHDYTKLIFFRNYMGFDKIINGVKIYSSGNGKPWWDSPKIDVTNVYPGLWKVAGVSEKLINKVINKFNEGIYTGRDVDLRNSDFNFIT